MPYRFIVDVEVEGDTNDPEGIEPLLIDDLDENVDAHWEAFRYLSWVLAG